jgi:putative FmdB family regulatory protein
MPIYEYRRPDGTTFDVRQSFSDEPLTVDPETGVPVERVLHPPAVHFKGKGFYSTDYGTRKRQRETAAAAEGGSSSDGAPSESSKSAAAGGERSGTPAESKATGAKAEKGSGGTKASRPVTANG